MLSFLQGFHRTSIPYHQSAGLRRHPECFPDSLSLSGGRPRMEWVLLHTPLANPSIITGRSFHSVPVFWQAAAGRRPAPADIPRCPAAHAAVLPPPHTAKVFAFLITASALFAELINQNLLNIRKIPDGKQNVLHRHVRSQQDGRARAGKQKNGFPLLPQGGCWWSGLHDLFKQCFSIEFLHEFHVRYLFS